MTMMKFFCENKRAATLRIAALLLVIVLVLLIVLGGCSGANGATEGDTGGGADLIPEVATGSEANGAGGIQPISETTGPATPVAIPADAQAYAYFAVFEELYGTDTALNMESIYLALDLTDAKLADTTPLIALVEDFCTENGYTLLLDSHEGLTKKGYIEDLNFTEGFLISFSDVELGPDKLVTSASKWSSGLGAIGSDYTVELKGGVWEITNVELMWIS